MSEYKITVGIECHVQLNTKTKLFSAVDNDAVDKEPNSCVSPFDYALPGMLPVLNKEAVHKAVQAGLAMNCKIAFLKKHLIFFLSKVCFLIYFRCNVNFDWTLTKGYIE